MSGHFVPSIRFSLAIEGCKSSRFQVEPILCQEGYGIKVQVILVLTKGIEEEKYEYERIVHQEILSQGQLPDDAHCETAYEYFEGFYYNKISSDVVISLTALILKTYLAELVERCQLDLSDYFLDIDPPKKKSMGYQKG